jgi:dihydroneopterin aldolase
MGTHGVHESELRSPQPFEVDLDLFVDAADAARSDDLADTADYGAVLDIVAVVVAGPPRRLLESLSEAIADAVLRTPRVERVVVAVRKLDPPVLYEVDSTGVRIERARRRP